MGYYIFRKQELKSDFSVFSIATIICSTRDFKLKQTCFDRCLDSLFGRRRVLRSRGPKVKPCGMTVPQLELWDKGRWA